MKKIIFILFLALIWCCGQDPERSIDHLNGYWEIETVLMPDGSQREYTFSGTIDFLYVNDSLIGYRNKLKPNFDGTFTTSGDRETLKAVIEEGHLNLYYKTPFAEWKETVLKATETQLMVQNAEKIRYTYKRYEPLVID